MNDASGEHIQDEAKAFEPDGKKLPKHHDGQENKQNYLDPRQVCPGS
jgi:hypothetical protein